MIIGVGFDLVDIIRIERLIGDTRFLESVFSEEEREYIASQGRGAAQSAAGMFAAKEAFSKAVGTGLRGMPLYSIAVSHDALGAPYFKLTGAAQLKANELHAEFLLTITHTDNTAGAVVIAKTEEA